VGRWISYASVGLLVLTVAVVVFRPGDGRIVGTWVLDPDAVKVEGTEAERRATVQLLQSMQMRVTFTKSKMTVEMKLLGEERKNAGRYRVADNDDGSVDLEFQADDGTRRCKVVWTDRGILLTFNGQELPLRRA